MSVRQLRRDWEQHRDDLDLIIDVVQGDGKVIDERGAEADNAADARRAWLSKLQAWRSDVEDLLVRYPEPHGG